MDQGIALIIAAVVPSIVSASVGYFNDWRADRRAIKIAEDLTKHNEEVAAKLATNTAITEATHEEVTIIKKALNGDVK